MGSMEMPEHSGRLPCVDALCGELTHSVQERVHGTFGLGYMYDSNTGRVSFRRQLDHRETEEVTLLHPDSETFESLGGGYARDASRVFFEGIELPGVSPGTFEYISLEGNRYLSGHTYSGAFADWDGDQVVVRGKILSGVKASGFGYCEALRCWTDGITTVRQNFIVRPITRVERVLFETSTQKEGFHLAKPSRGGLMGA